MANGNMNFKFGIGFNVDKTGISEIKKELQDLKNLTSKDFLKINPGTSMKDVSTELSNINYTATTVEKALESAFNPKLETVNFSTFNNYLKQAGISVQDVYTNFSKAGAQGQEAFRKVSSQVYSTNQQLEKTETFLDKMAVTLSNSLKWNLASRAINELSGNIQEAYGYVKDLDSSLNDIRIVTGQSSEQMETFAKQANKAAQALGQSTTAYTNASLIYYQQGLDNEEVAARTEVTLKAANVTGQSTDEVSEQLTAVWNGYQVSADEAEVYVDRLAAVAASTASDLEELSTGMSKVASSAAAMGVGEEQLAAQLATIISVTRQAPESVGTALKTIYARMTDIEAGLDEDGVTLGNYTGEMAELGINVLDAQGKLRDMGEVIEEIGGKWSDYSREQQVALAQTMAGKLKIILSCARLKSL